MHLILYYKEYLLHRIISNSDSHFLGIDHDLVEWLHEYVFSPRPASSPSRMECFGSLEAKCTYHSILLLQSCDTPPLGSAQPILLLELGSPKELNLEL